MVISVTRLFRLYKGRGLDKNFHMREIDRAGWLTAAFALLLAAAPARSGDFDKIAAQLSRAAKAHGRLRIAVLPFQVIGGKGSSSGRIVSERLMGPLMAEGSVEVVERTMLDGVMREQQLQFSGVADARSVKELGKILNVDALVMGTVIALKDDRVEINARLIDAETAKVLFAAAVKTEQDWNESLFDDASWGGLPLPSLPNFDLAVAGGGCGGAATTEDDYERSLLDLKARYWAQKLREGLDGATLRRNPGSEIRNPEIRAEFYRRLNIQHAVAGPDLTGEERGRLKDTLERISRLKDSCSGEGA
jgi:TolB-like protein